MKNLDNLFPLISKYFINLKSVTAFFLLTLASQSSPGIAGEGLYHVPLKSIEGKASTLAPYQGKVLLIVNTASQCGYTPQYAALEKLYEKYKNQGLVVLGFPSNDFGGQEPGTNSQIKYFCQSTYHVSFPLFEKGSVSGESTQSLYKLLLSESNDHSEIGWNFEKFLISRNGSILQRYKSSVTPDDPQLVKNIELALKTGPTPTSP